VVECLLSSRWWRAVLCRLRVRILAHEDYKIGLLAAVTPVSHEFELTSPLLL
jgi:hypothetical protein